MVCAGIDTGKRQLDVALHRRPEQLRVDNTAAGHESLSAWLRRHRVKRAGIEASGGYERAVVARLRDAGLIVILFQPAQVRAYAGFVLQRAKNDKLDAALIAACTAATETIHAPPDPRLARLAEQLRVIEQLKEDLARDKTRRESCHDGQWRDLWTAEIPRHKVQIARLLDALVEAIRQHPDLAKRLDLLTSIAAIGVPTALAILIYLPEIAQLTREQAAALAGLAPYDADSGERHGQRHIAGGRERLRHALYGASLAGAFHRNAQLKLLYQRLIAAGKPHKLALIACARKLLIYALTVVQRGTPWRPKPAAA
jgi:transposase